MNHYETFLENLPERLKDRYLKNDVPKIIAHLIQHVDFQIYRAKFAGVIWRNRQMMTNAYIKQCYISTEVSSE